MNDRFADALKPFIKKGAVEWIANGQLRKYKEAITEIEKAMKEEAASGGGRCLGDCDELCLYVFYIVDKQDEAFNDVFGDIFEIAKRSGIWTKGCAAKFRPKAKVNDPVERALWGKLKKAYGGDWGLRQRDMKMLYYKRCFECYRRRTRDGGLG